MKVKESIKMEKSLDLGLQQLLDDPNCDIDIVLDILWQQRVVDHIAPVGGMSRDADCYWRILYAAASAHHATVHAFTFTTTSGGYIYEALSLFVRVILDEVWGRFKEKIGSDAKNPCTYLFDYFMERARKELLNLGVTPHTPLIPIDARGKWRGVEVIIDRYSDTGLIILRATNRKGHEKLYDLCEQEGLGLNCVLPSSLDPSQFSVAVAIH